MTLRRFNNILSVVVIGLALYVLLAPVFPEIAFWWRTSIVKTSTPLVTAVAENKTPATIPSENTLVIPRLHMQQRIHEGTNASWALAKGVWRDPKGSTPDKDRNTVLTGHRFTYAGAAVFYHLDKVQVGDQIVVYWNQQKHAYRVQDIKVAPPVESSIAIGSHNKALTIYTCTPLITAKDRLIITALPIEEEASQ